MNRQKTQRRDIEEQEKREQVDCMLNTFEFTLENKWIPAITLILVVIGQLQQKKLIICMQLFEYKWTNLFYSNR